MELTVQNRKKFGKATKTLRRQGLIPAELYGHGVENLHLNMSAKEFQKVFKQAGESTLINLVLGGEQRPAMIHDINVDPITDEVLSVDFYQVRLDERIKVKVPLNFIGDSPAVKDKGGVLVKAVQELEVEALPGNLPHSLDVDISLIQDIGGNIHVKDIKLGGDVKILANDVTVVAAVIEKVSEEAVAAAPEVTVESVKVETEEKKVERQAKKAASPEASLASSERESAPPKAEKPKT